MPAPVFIDGIIAAGRVFGKAYEVVDRVFNAKEYYEDRDVIIINQARKSYLAVFQGRSLPSELRYNHESQEDSAVLSETPQSPPYQYHRPPYKLDQEYSLQGVIFGSNSITETCKNSVAYIHTYLNALNEKAASMFKIRTYGHENDGVRFIFFLLRNAFIEMSKLNLDEHSALEEADCYISFLKKLQGSVSLDNAIRKIYEVDVGALDGKQARKAPSMLLWVNQSLKKIENNIKYRLSKCSIATQTETLLLELDQLVNAGVIFSTYIISAKEMGQEAMATSRPGGGSIDAGNFEQDELLFLQRNLSVALSQSNPTSQANQADHNLKILDTATEDVNFYYKPEKNEWVGVAGRTLSSGVYAYFKEDKQEFIRFCVQLKNLGDLRKSVSCIKDLLGTGGDLIAVVRLAEGIRFALAMAGDTVDAMLESQEKLFAAASAHLNDLSNQKDLSGDQQAWMSNFSCIGALFPCDAKYRQIVSNFKNAMSQIIGRLDDWAENPQKNLIEFENRYSSLVVSLALSGKRLAVYNSAIGSLFVAWRKKQPQSIESQSLTFLDRPLPHGVQSKVVAVGGSFVEELPDDVCVVNTEEGYKVIEAIKKELTEYSIRHSYFFNLKCVEKSIFLTNPARKQQHDSTDKDYKDDAHHIMRRSWLYRVFEVLYQQESEEAILDDLKALIKELYSPSFKLHHAFTSNDNKNGIESVIERINTRIEKRLAKLAVVKVDERKPLPLAIDAPIKKRLAEVVVQVYERKLLPLAIDAPINSVDEELYSQQDFRRGTNERVYKECMTVSELHALAGGENELLSSKEEIEMQLKERSSPGVSTDKVPVTPAGVIAVFDCWVKSYEDKEDALFLDFWRKMTYSRESKNPFTSAPTTKKLLEHSQLLASVQTLEKRELLLTQVEEGLNAGEEPKKDWALMAVKTAGGVVESDAKLWVAKQKEKLNTELSSKKKLLDNKKILKGVAAWSEEVYAELKNAINKLKANIPNIPNIQADTILGAVALRLLKKSPASESEEAARKERELDALLSQEQLDEYLCVILERYQETYEAESAHNKGSDVKSDNVRSEKVTEKKVDLFGVERDFYLEIAKGLLHMRANPLVWMKKQQRATRTVRISENSAAGYFLVAAQIDLILSYLQYKASYIGEFDLFLKVEFDEFSAALKAFADKLVKCVSSDNDLSWKLYAAIFCGKGELPKGVRYERATLMWLGLEFFYTIVDEQLYELGLDHGVAKKENTKESRVYKDICARLEQAKRIYYQAVKNQPFHYNVGLKTFEDLVAKLSILEMRISEKIKTHKIMWHNVMVTEEARREKEVISREKDILNDNMNESIRNLAMQELSKRFIGVAISGESWVRKEIKQAVDILQGVFRYETRDRLEGIVFGLIKADDRFSCIRRFVEVVVEPQDKTQQSRALSAYGTFARSATQEGSGPKKAANASL